MKDLATDKGRVKLLELTLEGRTALEAAGESAGRSHRKGVLDHEYWKKRLAEEYRAEG